MKRWTKRSLIEYFISFDVIDRYTMKWISVTNKINIEVDWVCFRSILRIWYICVSLWSSFKLTLLIHLNLCIIWRTDLCTKRMFLHDLSWHVFVLVSLSSLLIFGLQLLLSISSSTTSIRSVCAFLFFCLTCTTGLSDITKYFNSVGIVEVIWLSR